MRRGRLPAWSGLATKKAMASPTRKTPTTTSDTAAAHVFALIRRRCARGCCQKRGVSEALVIQQGTRGVGGSPSGFDCQCSKIAPPGRTRGWPERGVMLAGLEARAALLPRPRVLGTRPTRARRSPVRPAAPWSCRPPGLRAGSTRCRRYWETVTLLRHSMPWRKLPRNLRNSARHVFSACFASNGGWLAWRGRSSRERRRRRPRCFGLLA